MRQDVLTKLQSKRIWRSNVIWAIGINLFFFLLILLFCDLKYEVSDDFVMATIMSGAHNRGEPNPHMIFVNVIIGYILIPFYKIFPQVSWYFVFQLAVLLVSFTLITYMLLEKNGKALGSMLTVMLLVFFADDAYILVQFTKTAAVVVMCASLVFIWSLFEGRKKILIVLSGILCIIGTMYRFSSIYLAGGYLLVVLAAEFWGLYRKEKRWNKKGALIILCGAVLIAGAYLCREINTRIYQSSEQYAEFLDYSRVRTQIVDVADYGYDAYRQGLEELDVSENDYWLLRRWNFTDPEVFPKEKLKKIGEVLAEHQSEYTMALGDIYEQMQARKLMAYPIVLACICLLILTVVLQRYQWIFCAVSVIFAVMLEAGFFRMARVIYRVEYGVFICAFLTGCYFWKKVNLRFDINKKELLRISLVVMTGLLIWEIPLFVRNSAYEGVVSEGRKDYLDEVFYDSWGYDARKYRRVVNRGKPENGLIKEIEENKENFYFLDFRTTIQTLYYEWSPFENVSPEFYDNCMYFSGIMTEFPGLDKITDSYGIDNHFKDLLDENVYIVDNENVDARLIYLQEHYDSKVRAELYKEVGGYQIWKFFVK